MERQLGQNWGNNSALDTCVYFSHRSTTSESHLSMSFFRWQSLSPLSDCLSLSLQCGVYARIIGSADINLLHRPCGAPLVTPLQREVNMWDAMDDPLWRSNVWLHNAFSIQRGERRRGTGTGKRWEAEVEWVSATLKRVKQMRAGTTMEV